MENNDINSEYVNMKYALSRVGGNMSLYKRLLSRFVEGNYYDLLAGAIESGDVEEAMRQAHSLKGVSANLSLTGIWTISVELEQLLKDKADYALALGELENAYAKTTEIISEILD